MPSFRKISGQGGHFRSGSGAAEALKMTGLGWFTGALNITAAGFALGGAPRPIVFGGNGEPSPMAGEAVGGQGLIVALEAGGLTSVSYTPLTLPTNREV